MPGAVADESRSAGALAGLRVIDFGQYVAGPLATMIMADNGADVIRVDPPGGPRWRHHANAILQRGKRSIVLDLKDPDDRARAQALVASADVVVEGFRPGVMDRLGVGPAAMTATNPRLVYLSLPGFAHDDPRAGLAGWEGIVSAAASDYTPPTAFITGLASVAETEPSFSAHPVASTMGAIVGVNSVLAALIARNRSGRGQAVEVPLFGAMFEVLNFDAQTVTPKPSPIELGPVLMGECADGRFVQVLLMVPRHHRWFTARCFPPEWIAEGFGDPKWVRSDPERANEFVRRALELLKTKPAEEWDRILNEAGVPATMFQTTEEWLEDEQARAIDAVIPLSDPQLGDTVQAGYPVWLDATPPRARGPRHAVDGDRDAVLAELGAEAAAASDPAQVPPVPSAASVDGTPAARNGHLAGGPLQGLRVVDLTMVMAGPAAGRVLAELGAEVIKINQPDYPIGLWAHPNSGKRTALVDLGTEGGRDVFWGLVERADVVLDNYTRGATERLGVGAAQVRARFPGVVHATVSTYSHRGPRGGFRGYEHLGQARTGITLRRGAGRPVFIRFALCDYGTGHLAATGTLLALYHRDQTGAGQRVEASLVQTGTYFQVPFMIDYEGRTWDEPSGPAARGWGALDRLYRGADGWFYLAAQSSGDDARVAAVAGVEVPDEASLTAAFAEDTVDRWVDRLQAAGVAAERMCFIDALMEDEVVKAQGLSVTKDHHGIGRLRGVGVVPRFSATPVTEPFPSPLPGADTRTVVVDAGLGARFAELLAARAVTEGLPENISVSP